MDSADDLAPEPAELLWVEELAALAGWSGGRRPIEWESAERELGLRLPQDYKLLGDTFGAGTFDDNLDFCVPGSHRLALELIRADRTEFAGTILSGQSPVELLQWATTSAGHSFCWLVEDPDPEHWPIFARSDKWEPWERFDCSAGEFIYRMLSDPQHPYSLAKFFETHWFAPAGEVDPAEEAFWDEYHPRW
ncbi:SMI1/KNR4 family protein [Kitasatospora phosalacinea]|uniref:SMI1/KNR4 family protein n=1 Tax=Kitasatospora phosalacinea TaxID=2065 RepID=UPI0036469B56